jgi:hypothetical protein
MVANPNFTRPLENILLFWNLKNTLQENMGYLIHHHFFQAGIKVPIVLFSWTLVHFFNTLFFFLFYE